MPSLGRSPREVAQATMWPLDGTFMMLPRPSATVWNEVTWTTIRQALGFFWSQGDFGVLFVLPSTVAALAPASFVLSARAHEAARSNAIRPITAIRTRSVALACIKVP